MNGTGGESQGAEQRPGDEPPPVEPQTYPLLGHGYGGGYRESPGPYSDAPPGQVQGGGPGPGGQAPPYGGQFPTMPYGQGPGGPYWPPPAGPGAPPRPSGGKGLVIAVIGGGLALVVVIGLVAVVIARAGGPGPVATRQTASQAPAFPLPAAWAKGACVKSSATAPGSPSSTSVPSGPGSEYALANCSDPLATGSVLRVLPAASAGTEPDCPDETDDAITVESTKTACVRNLREPHPGDAGQGGGVVRVGDCVGDPTFGLGDEEACDGTDWFGKVVARETTQGACPKNDTWETVTLKASARPILCLGRGGKVLAPGDCIEDLSKFGKTVLTFSIKKVPCGDKKAWAKITARVDRSSQCPGNSTRFLEAQDKQRFRRVTCMRTL